MWIRILLFLFMKKKPNKTTLDFSKILFYSNDNQT